MATIYGPQAWTAGTFSVPGSSTGPDANYPEIQYREAVETVNAAGPAGERIIDGTGNYADSALTIVNFGPSSGYWLASGDGEGVFYEGDFKFDSDAEADTFGFNYPFVFGVYRTTPSVGFVEVFNIRASLDEGVFYYSENGVESVSGFGTISADNAWHRIKVLVKPDSGGGNGIITVWLDDVQIFTKTNSTLVVPSFGGNPADGVNYVNHGRYGLLPTTNFHIYTGSAGGGSEEDVEVFDNSPHCCGNGPLDTVSEGGGTGAGAAINQTPQIGTQLSCAGGGLVPTQASLVHAETWWGN